MEDRVRVLAVDDDKLVRMNLQLSFEREGFEVDTASTCAEARALLSSRHYDVVLTDLGLPDECGLAVVRLAKQLDPLTRVILLTGSLGDLGAGDVSKAGADDLVLKPFCLHDLIERARPAPCDPPNMGSC